MTHRSFDYRQGWNDALLALCSVMMDDLRSGLHDDKASGFERLCVHIKAIKFKQQAQRPVLTVINGGHDER